MPKKLPIFYSALMLTGVNLLLRLVSTSFQVYISGRIGAAGVGLLQLVMSVGGLAMTVGIAGIRTATMYLAAGQLGRKKPGNIPWVLSGCFTYSILCSVAVSGLLYFLAPVLATHWIGDAQTLPAIRLFACFLPVTCLSGVMIGYFTAANRIGTLAAVEIAEQMLYMAVTMTLLITWAGHDPVRACQCMIFGSGICSCFCLLCLTALRLRERTPSAPRLPIRQQLLQIAVPLALADDLKAGISTTENLMVPKRLSLYPLADNPLAAFGMVCGMVFPVLMFPAAILFALAELLIPELARCSAAGSNRRIRYLAGRSLKVALLYGCLFCGLEYLLSRELCLWLYKSEEAGQHLRLYAILMPVLYCDAITDAMIKGLGEQKASVRYNILTSSMDVVFLFFLLPKYGMIGYFFSFLVTHLVNFVLSVRRLFRIVGRVISLSLPVMTVLATAAAVFISSHVYDPVLRGISFLVCQFCLLVLLRVVDREDLRWLHGLAKGTAVK